MAEGGYTAKDLSGFTTGTKYRRVLNQIEQGQISPDIEDAGGRGTLRRFSFDQAIRCAFLNYFYENFIHDSKKSYEIMDAVYYMLPTMINNHKNETKGFPRYWLLAINKEDLFTGCSFDLDGFEPGEDERDGLTRIEIARNIFDPDISTTIWFKKNDHFLPSNVLPGSGSVPSGFPVPKKPKIERPRGALPGMHGFCFFDLQFLYDKFCYQLNVNYNKQNLLFADIKDADPVNFFMKLEN
jgi:hypothetical protein